MTPLLPDDFVGKCVKHFEHACEKRPDFTEEIHLEIVNGNIPAAIEEAYDAIAVLVRTICVLEGKEQLAKGGGAV